MPLGTEADPVAKALWYIEHNFAGELTLAAVTAASGVSRFHLSRAFGETTGYSVMRYVRARRLTEAARALHDGAPDILSVALAYGYASHEAFTRAFRELFGVTPETVRSPHVFDTLARVEALGRDRTMSLNVQAPRLEHAGEKLFAGRSERFTYETAQRIPLLWQRFAPYIGHIAGQRSRDTYGVFWDSDDDGFEYLAAVEVETLDGLANDLRGLRVPARTYAVFVHRGHVSTLRATMDAIWTAWLPAASVTAVDAPKLERYGPAFDPQTGNGAVEIWIPCLASPPG